MKKVLMAALVAMLGLMAVGCGSEMHNTPASYVTLEVVNFPNGDYDWRGAFANNAWNGDNKRKFTVADGAGTYTGTDELIIVGKFEFSILAQEGSWVRSWYPTTEGNENDYGNGYLNWLISIPMDGATHAIKIDGATIPATIYVDGAMVDNTQGDKN